MNTLKTRIVLGLGFGLIAAIAVRAEESIDPVTLGNLDAVIAFCGEINPAGAPSYAALKKTVVGSEAAEAVEAVTQKPEYHEAYEATRKNATGQSHEAALNSCQSLAPVHAASEPRAEARKVQQVEKKHPVTKNKVTPKKLPN